MATTRSQFRSGLSSAEQSALRTATQSLAEHATPIRKSSVSSASSNFSHASTRLPSYRSTSSASSQTGWGSRVSAQSRTGVPDPPRSGRLPTPAPSQASSDARFWSRSPRPSTSLSFIRPESRTANAGTQAGMGTLMSSSSQSTKTSSYGGVGIAIAAGNVIAAAIPKRTKNTADSSQAQRDHEKAQLEAQQQHRSELQAKSLDFQRERLQAQKQLASVPTVHQYGTRTATTHTPLSPFSMQSSDMF